MKIGTDGVLLGAWTAPGDAKNVLDIGTGTGLIALMLAQKSDAKIEALEIDRDAYVQAKENFQLSPWSERLECIYSSLQQYAKTSKEKYDLIVSNPPYFINSPRSTVDARATARHMDEALSPEELADSVAKLLSENGMLNMILPLKEGNVFMVHAEKRGLYINRMVRVYTKPDKNEKRLLLTFSKTRKEILSEKLVIQNENGDYTKEFIDLTSPYYTHLPGLPYI